MNNIKLFVKQKLEHEPTGHDYLHALRVLENAKRLLIEDVDIDVVFACALVHDLIDHKLEEQYKASESEIALQLSESGLSSTQITHVFDIIKNMSYSKGNILTSLEGKIVQDADRLDALGAIGIARAFSYGGKNNRLIYHPLSTDSNDSVSHFYQKLFKLEGLMNTEKGRTEAKVRSQYMKQYIEQLYKEIKKETR